MSLMRFADLSEELLATADEVESAPDRLEMSTVYQLCE